MWLSARDTVEGAVLALHARKREGVALHQNAGVAGFGAGAMMTSAMRITVDIPEPLAGQPADKLASRARLLLVIDEVRAGRMSRAGAARALAMSLDDFLIEAGTHGVYAIDYDLDDFKRELDNVAAQRT
jgi:predicted HTH domain antitoxin